jgi:hypothetical protein
MGEHAAGPDVSDATPVDGGADGPEGVAEADAPAEEEVRENTDEAVRAGRCPQSDVRAHVWRLRRRANRVQREVRELRSQARRRGDHDRHERVASRRDVAVSTDEQVPRRES